jgi:hypothetical protein
MVENVEVEIVASDSEWSCGRRRNLVVLVWRGETTADRARKATEVLREMAEQRAGGIGIAVVVEPKAPPPEADVRPLFTAAMRECGPRIRGVAYVVPAGGFRGAAVRAAITGLSLVAREPYPTHVFAESERAAAWIAERLGEDWTTSRVSVTVERVRQA